jgi:hypothetical protein
MLQTFADQARPVNHIAIKTPGWSIGDRGSMSMTMQQQGLLPPTRPGRAGALSARGAHLLVPLLSVALFGMNRRR